MEFSVRLKELRLTYTFPKELISKWRMSNLALSLSAYNLLTFTAFDWGDPESRQSDRPNYPLTRVFNIGLKVGF